MGALDGFIVTLAVPSIRADLGATFGQTQLIVAGYSTTFAAGLMIGGRLGDRFGHRRVFLAGMCAFVAASAACAAASSVAVLIAARLVQGLAAAAALPQVLSIIRSGFAERERGAAIGWYGAAVGFGVVCGPAFGGLLLAADVAGMGWRSIFLVNVPLGAAVAVGAAVVVRDTPIRTDTRLDLVGAGLGAAGLVALLVPLTLGAEAGWPAWMVGCLVAAAVLLAGFVAHERRLGARQEMPLVPLRLFRAPAFADSVLAMLVLSGAAVSAPLLFCLTYYLQSGLGLSPLLTGGLLSAVGLGFGLGSAAAPRRFARHGESALVGGISVAVAGLLGVVMVDVTVAHAARPVVLVPVLLVAAIGSGVAFNPLFDLALSGVPSTDAGAASGILLTTGQLAQAIGLGIFGSIFLALLADPGERVEPAAFSQALRWTVACISIVTAGAVPFVRRLRPTT